MSLNRNTLLAIFLALILTVWISWMLRYDMQVASTPDGYPVAYRLDRWTGEMRFVDEDQWYPVVQGDPEALRYPVGQPSKSVY